MTCDPHVTERPSWMPPCETGSSGKEPRARDLLQAKQGQGGEVGEGQAEIRLAG